MTCILKLGKHQEPLPMFGLNLCEPCPTCTSTCHHGHRRESPRLYMPSFAPLCTSPVLKSPAPPWRHGCDSISSHIYVPGYKLVASYHLRRILTIATVIVIFPGGVSRSATPDVIINIDSRQRKKQVQKMLTFIQHNFLPTFSSEQRRQPPIFSRNSE